MQILFQLRLFSTLNVFLYLVSHKYWRWRASMKTSWCFSIVGVSARVSFSALTLMVGWQKGHLVCIKTRATCTERFSCRITCRKKTKGELDSSGSPKQRLLKWKWQSLISKYINVYLFIYQIVFKVHSTKYNVILLQVISFIMAALHSRCRHYIFVLWFLLTICFFYLSFFPRLFSAVTDWMSTILPHMVRP